MSRASGLGAIDRAPVVGCSHQLAATCKLRRIRRQLGLEAKRRRARRLPTGALAASTRPAASVKRR
jgi:hypothetical protein